MKKKGVEVVKDLKVVESGLVPVYEDKQARNVINARELHGFLESGRQFANWIQERIEKYGFSQGEDFEVFNEIVKNPQGGRPTTEYLLTLDTAKEIAMVENNEKGRQVRKYFIECERRLHEAPNALARKDAEKLRMERERLDLMRRRVDNESAKILQSMAKDFRDILSPVSLQSINSHVTMLTTGKVLVELPEVETLFTAKEVGEMADISANMVGRIANLYDLKTPEYGKMVLDKSPHCNKQVSTFRYNRAGADKIVQLVKEGAVIRAKDVAQVS